MATTTAGHTVLANLRDALHAHDEQRLLEVYADDAVVISYSERNRPSSARRIEGHDAIAAWIHDYMSRNLKHAVSDEVIADDRFAYLETCEYPSGELVVGTYVCQVRDGRISRQVGAEAWDE